MFERGQKAAQVLVDLDPTTSIAGGVEGTDGRDGIVLAYTNDGGEAPPRQGHIVGDRFSVIGLEPGSYSVRFLVPGYLPFSLESVSLDEGDHVQDLSIALEKGRTVLGTVRDDQGTPAPGVEISARSSAGDGLEQFGQSDSSGMFSISGLLPGPYALRSRSPGFRISPSGGPIVVGQEDLRDVRVVLSPLGSIKVRLSSSVVGGAVAFAVPEDIGLSDFANKAGWVEGQLQDDDSFYIPGLLQGAYFVAIRAPGHVLTYFPGTSNSDEAWTITVLDGETTFSEAFGILKGSTLSGHVGTRDSDDPIHGAAVEIFSLDRKEVYTITTDNEGRYELSGVGSGRYLVQVRAEGYIAQFFPGAMRAEEATPLEVDGKRHEENISLTMPVRQPADFNEDGHVDVSDLERFLDRVSAGGVTANVIFDVSQDGLVKYDDFEYVMNQVRNSGKMIDPPTIMDWKSVDGEPGQIRAALRAWNLAPSVGYLTKIYFDPDEADFLGGDTRASIYKDGRMKVEEIGPGVLLIVGGSSDRDEREGDGELISLIFQPKEGHESVRLRTDAAVTLLPKGRMSSPVLPEPIRLSLPPETFYLLQNVPNPFNPETSIAYELPEAVQVKLAIYNLVGQKIRGLIEEFKTAGRYDVRWDGKDDFGRDVGSGVYFDSLEAGSFSTTRRMLLIR